MTSRSQNNEKKLNKGPWTEDEDKVLKAYVEEHGAGNWNVVSENSGLSRCGKSCRFRWVTYLRPDLKQGPITDEEDMLITQLHAIYGNTWAKIASQLPGRTDNEIKNFWNTKVKRLEKKGLPIYPNGVQVRNGAAQSFGQSNGGYLRTDQQISIPINDPSSYLRDGIMKKIQSSLKTSESPYPLSHREPQTLFPLTGGNTTMNVQSSFPWDYAITPWDYPYVDSTPVEQFTQQIPPMLDNDEHTTSLGDYSFVEITREQMMDYLQTTASSSSSQPLINVVENMELPSFQSHQVPDSLGAQQSDPMQVHESDNNTLLHFTPSSHQSDPMQVLESVNNTLVQVPASSQQSDPMQVPESDNNTLLHVLASDFDQWFESMQASHETRTGDDSCPSYSDVEEWLNQSGED